MRKVLAAAMALLLAVLLGACSGNAPDFKSMLDTETDKRYALGDEKEKFDADFGAGNYDDDFDEYNYLDGVLTVAYADDRAVELSVRGGSNRFEFFDFSFDMALEDVIDRYEKSEYEYSSYDFYSIRFDGDGNHFSANNNKANRGRRFREQVVNPPKKAREGNTMVHAYPFVRLL